MTDDAERIAAKVKQRIEEMADYPKMMHKAAIAAIVIDLRDDIRELLARKARA